MTNLILIIKRSNLQQDWMFCLPFQEKTNSLTFVKNSEGNKKISSKIAFREREEIHLENFFFSHPHFTLIPVGLLWTA